MGPNWAGSEFVRCIFWDGAPRGEGPVHGAQDSTWRTVGASWMRNRGTGEHRPSGRGRPDTGVGTLGLASRGCVKDHAVPAPCGAGGAGAAASLGQERGVCRAGSPASSTALPLQSGQAPRQEVS